MQDPNEDTEWNDILRAKGILPPKPVEPPEPEPEPLTKDIEDQTLDELLADFEADAEDDRALQEFRRKRMMQMQQEAELANKFGRVLDITAKEYTAEVNEASHAAYVVLVLYKPESIIDELAAKHKSTKFVRSISTSCIPNYPDRNLPTVFIYHQNEMKQQWVGPGIFGGERMTAKVVESVLAGLGAVELQNKDDEDDEEEEEVARRIASTIRGASKPKKPSDDDDDDDD